MGLFRGGSPSAPATWLNWPTLKSSAGVIKTAGVYYHQKELKQSLKAFGPLVMAELRIEPKGKYAGAVRVRVGGTEVGSLPAGMAADYHSVIAELHDAGLPATGRAQLEVGQESFDVWLIAVPERKPDDEPFLPAFSSAQVALYGGQAEALEASMNSRAKTKRVTRIGLLTNSEDRWLLSIDGEWIGALGDGAYPELDKARVGGFPLTCRVDLSRKPDRPFQVTAGVPATP